MSVFDMMAKKLASQAKRVIIGFPSQDNAKATGLQYSVEYYAKESVNTSRSDTHKLVAKVAHKVLTSEEFLSKVEELVDKFVSEELHVAYENSGLKAEDEEQEKNGKKIVIPKPARAAATKKSPAKKTASKAKTTAK